MSLLPNYGERQRSELSVLWLRLFMSERQPLMSRLGLRPVKSARISQSNGARRSATGVSTSTSTLNDSQKYSPDVVAPFATWNVHLGQWNALLAALPRVIHTTARSTRESLRL